MGFEFNAKLYENASAHQQEWGTALIDELTLRGNERILDLGCGDGRLTAKLAERVPDGHVLGIDSSQGMIDRARDRETINLKFTLHDIYDVAELGEFDVIFSNATLHWVKDHQRLWRDIDRILVPGGKIRFNFAGEGNCGNFLRIIGEAMLLPEYKAAFNDFIWPWYMPSVAEYTRIIEKYECYKVNIWFENADRYFPNSESLTGWIDQPSLVPFMAYLDEKTGSAFRDFVKERMISQTIQSDGRFFETFRRINVAAEKQVKI